MKKTLIALNIIVLVVALTMIVLFMKSNCSSTCSETERAPSASSDLTIAYINSDSIIMNYKMAIDLNTDFMEKQKTYNQEFGQKRFDLEKQAAAFQEKVERGGFLTEQRAIQERDRIMGQSEEIKKLDYDLSNKLAEMEAEMNKKVADNLIKYIENYNKDKKYSYILNNSGSIIVGDQSMNITKEILDGLNAKYEASK